MAPILEELKGRMGEKVRIIKIDTERHQELAASLQIRSIPTLMLYREGKLLWRHSGTAGASELERIIEQQQ
jgi:thioredoxin 1